jgi:heptaprenyl diphosphate synthase
MSNTKRQAVLIILVCNAIVISFLEALLPLPIPVPGVKLGLANILTMLAIVFLDLKSALIIVVLRSIAVTFVSKGLFALVFGLAGGLLSAALMWFLYKKLPDVFSIKGISIAGAIIHNTAQMAVASWLLREPLIFYYLPVLGIAAVITGFFTGSICEMVVGELKKRGFLEGL